MRLNLDIHNGHADLTRGENDHEPPEPPDKPKRNRPSRTAKERARYRLNQILEQAQRVAGYGQEVDLCVRGIVSSAESALGVLDQLPDDIKQARGAASKIVRIGQIYEIKSQAEQYSRLAGEPVECGIAVAELDERTVKMQVGESTFIPVKKAHLGKILEG